MKLCITFEITPKPKAEPEKDARPLPHVPEPIVKPIRPVIPWYGYL